MTLDIDSLLKLAPLEERVYRLRCVEGWSMVIPWIGYSLSELIKKVEPTGNAKYVQFISQADKKQMPGVNSRILEWPYAEGLRMDEASHPLSLLTFGMYGEVLPNQNGAPVRIVVPWKYGFKSAKSIVKIRFMRDQPKTAWNLVAPREYGFYSNVNPQVDHPRWSQASERRIGEDGLFTRKRKALMFNGYSEVASLYQGMDLKKFFLICFRISNILKPDGESRRICLYCVPMSALLCCHVQSFVEAVTHNQDSTVQRGAAAFCAAAGVCIY